MADGPENEPTIAENEPTIVENAPTIPKNEEAPQPKSRGRPKGAKDNKPRIKRVPVEAPEEKPQVRPKKVVQHAVQHEAEEVEPEEPPPEPEVEEEEPPPPKSPRTLHRERVQQAALERRRVAMERQDHFERILDNFMGF